jgi:hypothetical protein
VAAQPHSTPGLDVAAFLEARSVPFAVIGGIAVGVRGEPSFTAHIDLVIGVEIEKGLELLAAVKGPAFAPLFPGADEVVRTSYMLPLRHRQTLVKVDLAIGLTGFERQLIARARREDLGGVHAPVAAAENLLILKVFAGRPRDTEDARTIALKQGPALDWDFVLETGKALEEAVGQDLLSQLSALRRQSSPGVG